MTLLQLRDEDARIVYLATVYHLGRPGSETDPETLQKHDLGLQAIHDTILPELGHAVVEVDVSPYQLMRIAEALLGITNELKQYALSGNSSVARFAETLHWLYPDTVDNSGEAMDLVQHPVKLRNALDYAVRDAQAQVEAARAAAQEAKQADRRRWWDVFKRSKR